MIFARKMPDYIIRQRDRGQAEAYGWGRGWGRGRGQSFKAEAEAEAEAEAKSLRLKPKPKFWPRGHFGLEDLTSLHSRHRYIARFPSPLILYVSFYRC